eukprot:1827495-Rhodomonas_salina.2
MVLTVVSVSSVTMFAFCGLHELSSTHLLPFDSSTQHCCVGRAQAPPPQSSSSPQQWHDRLLKRALIRFSSPSITLISSSSSSLA